MSRIRVLPPHIANKIAAGEVVDRPASVVKELVENAIDAGADRITIVLEQAGKELIQVVDNGIGMPEEDVPLAFERHATSKISDEQDLDRILTLGFRGEALPSIASVSRLEIKSCQEGEGAGTMLRINGGKIEAREKVAMKRGTTVSVKNIFFNTPARRNFLKTDTTELNQIMKWIRRFFLSCPQVHFTLIHNGEELFNIPAASQDERIVQTFGQEFYDGLAFVRQELNEIVLEGYVCRPDHARGNSANQFIYLNRRTIINRSLAHAVFQGYGNLIDRSRYPQFVLFLQIPPQLVDINVHPTKMEVRFANERVIYHLFLSAVRKAVQSPSGDMVPAFKLKPGSQADAVVRRKVESFALSRPEPANSEGRSADHAARRQMSFSYQPLPPARAPEAAPEMPERAAPVQANLWQVHNRYIISQIKSGMVVIDQHVAHERILYEQILDYLNQGKNVPSQQLLFPHTMELALEDYLVYSDIREWLQRIGFRINPLSGRTIVLEAIPADVRVGNEGRILIDIIDFYRENQGGQFEPHEKIAAAFACKGAIKSGDKLTLAEMNALVDQLFATREPYFCPHGRPVIVTVDLEELDRKFKRI